MTTRTDTASRFIGASAARIYRALATRSALERWLPPEGMSGEMLAFDFREGGGYRMRLTYHDADDSPGKSSTDSDDVTVRFARLSVDRLIEQVVTFESEDSAFAGEMRVTWTLEPVEDGTVVSVRCDNVPPGISAADHESGLRSTLQNLAAYTDGADGSA